MGERSFSRESEWIEATPGGGRLPGGTNRSNISLAPNGVYAYLLLW